MTSYLNKMGSIVKIFKNFYFVITLSFLLWVTFLDSHNLLLRWQLNKQYKTLKQNKEEYLVKIEELNRKKVQLEDLELLERIAREKYLMKRKGEDLYIVS